MKFFQNEKLVLVTRVDTIFSFWKSIIIKWKGRIYHVYHVYIEFL